MLLCLPPCAYYCGAFVAPEVSPIEALCIPPRCLRCASPSPSNHHFLVNVFATIVFVHRYGTVEGRVCPGVGEPEDAAIRKAAEGLLFWWNCDWRNKGPKRLRVHWTPAMSQMYPSGLSKDDVVGILHSCWGSAGLFGSGQKAKPAKSRWWSMVSALSKQVCGFNMNAALPDILDLSFPTWESGEPVAVDGEDLSEDYRKMIRSKVYRAKLYTKDWNLRRLATCVLFCAEALDHLGMRLQHESANGSILLAVLHADTNPFFEAQQVYSGLLCQPREETDTLVTTLFHFFGGEQDKDIALALLILELCLTMSSMLWVMCEAPLSELPFPLAALADVRSPDKAGVLRKHVFTRSPRSCSFDLGLTAKVVAVHPTVEAWLEDRPLMQGFSLWARHTKIENMVAERLLASFRRAAATRGHAVPSCERFISSGLATQLMTLHTGAGGADASTTTRSALLADGVPINAGRKRAKNPNMVRPSMIYANQRRAERKRFAGSTSNAASLTDLAHSVRGFKNLPEGDQQVYLDAARKRQDDGSEECIDGESAESMYQQRIGKALWGSSSSKEPFTPDVFDEAARSMKAGGQARNMKGSNQRVGITSYKEPQRSM